MDGDARIAAAAVNAPANAGTWGQACSAARLDEDDTEEVVTWGSGEVAVIHTGLDLAMMRARSAYVRGAIEVDEFEAEVERLLRKRERLRRGL